jgi:predicted lipoprotein with Yx(FWY)xxD motif
MRVGITAVVVVGGASGMKKDVEGSTNSNHKGVTLYGFGAQHAVGCCNCGDCCCNFVIMCANDKIMLVHDQVEGRRGIVQRELEMF